MVAREAKEIRTTSQNAHVYGSEGSLRAVLGARNVRLAFLLNAAAAAAYDDAAAASAAAIRTLGLA